jgi:hypothetical protein
MAISSRHGQTENIEPTALYVIAVCALVAIALL